MKGTALHNPEKLYHKMENCVITKLINIVISFFCYIFPSSPFHLFEMLCVMKKSSNFNNCQSMQNTISNKGVVNGHNKLKLKSNLTDISS